MRKHIDSVLYGLTVMYCFLITGLGMGDSSDIISYIGKRAVFYLVEAVLLIIVMLQCEKLNSKYDWDQFKSAEKIFEFADCVFVMIGLVVAFSVGEMILIFLFLPENIFKHGAANGFFVMIGITALVFFLHSVAAKKFGEVKKKKEEMLHPLGQKTEDFYAFINSPDEPREEEPDVSMDDVSYLLGESDSEGEKAEEARKAVVTDPLREPKGLWECPCCGSLNSVDSEKCDFCGAEPK